MKIVFFSSNSNYFNEKTYLIKTMPSWQKQWETFVNNHPEHSFICISQLPALFLPEDTIICDKDDSHDFALEIAKYNPDIVIPLSFWVDLYDWLPVKDALISEELLKMNIKVISNSVETAMICFNKMETLNFFDQINILQPKSIYINHDLYFCGGNRKEVKYNVYKEAVLSSISKLTFPLIIKDPVSLSSYGMSVVNTKGEAFNYLNSKKHSSDRLIQEFIKGINLGVELYGYYDDKNVYHCNIFPSFIFSTNQYGITSPKQSIKYGPIKFSDKLEEKLRTLILKVAEKLQLLGPAQIDLILKDEEFYIIEINPRLSGMTSSYCASLNEYFYEMIFKQLVLHKHFSYNDFYPTVNIKIPLQDYDKLQQLSEISYVRFLNQINNLEAKQEREKGYCEIIICGNNKKELIENLSSFKKIMNLQINDDFIKSF